MEALLAAQRSDLDQAVDRVAFALAQIRRTIMRLALGPIGLRSTAPLELTATEWRSPSRAASGMTSDERRPERATMSRDKYPRCPAEAAGTCTFAQPSVPT